MIGDISENEIETYNKAIEDHAEEIENYKLEYSIYDNIKNNSSELVISVSNTGKSKASDVFIDITFPKEVIIYEKGDYNNLPRPLPPHVPENPVEKALTAKSSWPKARPHIHRDIGIDYDLLSKINVNKPFWIDKDKNSLTIKVAKLTHTRTFSIKEDILIAPLAKGIFEYDVSIICDELNSPQTNSYKLAVE